MKRVVAAWLLGLASLSACSKKVTSLTEQERAVVNELTTNMQPRCVGRYLIDLPANLEVRGYAKLNKVVIEADAKPLRVFQLEMQRREIELKGAKSLHGYPRVLFDYGSVRGAEHTRYFVSLGDSTESNDARRVIEAYKWDHGYRLSLKIDASDWTESKYKDEPIVKNDPVKTNVPEKLRLAFDLIDRLQGRAEEVIPTEPGTCFKGGFLQGKAVSEDEEISSSFGLSGEPDVVFGWESYANVQAEKALIPRMKGEAVQEQLKAANGRILRLDSFVSNGGMKIDEALASGLTTSAVPGHLFSLETNYQGSASAPYVIFDMKSGYGELAVENGATPKLSLSDAEAAALWDAVTRTLRPRPNAF